MLIEDEELALKAKKYIYQIAKSTELYRFFVDANCGFCNNPYTFFMAGSPGAGKTEWSKNFIKAIAKNNQSILRIDADEIRELCPGYQGHNAHLFQGAAVVGVNKLYDYALKKSLNVLLDSTFANYYYAENNTKRALEKGRIVYIFYVYQEPTIAWEFTQKRERLDNRRITANIFINDFLLANENVKKMKNIFGDKIILVVIKKNYNNETEKLLITENLDNCLEFGYTSESLQKLIIAVKI